MASAGGIPLSDEEKARQRKVLGELTESGAKPAGWDEAWKQGVTPWDLGGRVNPAWASLLQSAEPPLPGNGAGRPRALVPGCGSGNDLKALAAAGFSAVGEELSTEATAVAAKTVGEVEFALVRTGDFFEAPEGEMFDLGYDYTFLCALHPDMRMKWASTWAQRLREGGELVTLMYPVTTKVGGPPYAVSAELYADLLGPAGFAPIEAGRKLADEECSPGRAGQEWIGRWRRK